MSRKQLTDEERAQMRSDAAALSAAFGSLDRVSREVAKTTPTNPPTKEAIRQAAEGKGGATVARALRLAAQSLDGSSPEAPAVEGYENRAAFLRLYGDKLEAPVREHIATYAGFGGDVSIDEWKARALAYVRERADFERALRGIGDEGGFGDPGPVKPRKPSSRGARRG